MPCRSPAWWRRIQHSSQRSPSGWPRCRVRSTPQALLPSILTKTTLSYFTKDSHPGVCVFRRRRTTESGQRGFRLSSLGVLLVNSARPRPWRHVDALKSLIDTIYSSLESRGVLEPVESDWEPAQMFFEERMVRRADLGGAGGWHGWSYELDNVRPAVLEFRSSILIMFILPAQRRVFPI